MSFEKCVLEIGANDGRDTEVLQNFYNLPVLAVEPTPFLLKKLWEKYGKHDNIFILPFAIDSSAGIKRFNIAGHSDWGCSSLHDFSDNIEEKWPDRSDFNFNDFCNICTITGAQLCELYSINNIEFLHLDAQGNDLRILQSFGSHIYKIKKGRCEAAYQVDLYKIDNKYYNIVNFLQKNGFQTIVVPDALNKKECDIFFEKRI